MDGGGETEPGARLSSAGKGTEVSGRCRGPMAVSLGGCPGGVGAWGHEFSPARSLGQRGGSGG